MSETAALPTLAFDPPTPPADPSMPHPNPPAPQPDPGERTPWSVLRAFLLSPFRARTWKEFAYLIVVFGLGCLAAAYLFFAVGGSAYLSIFVLGIPLLAAMILGARVWGRIYRVLGTVLLDANLPEPPPFTFRPGLFGWLRAAFTDRTAWRALLFLVLEFVLGVVVGYCVLLTVVITGFVAVSPIPWAVGNPTNVDDQGVAHHSLAQFNDYHLDTWPRVLAFAAVGVIGCFLLPWLFRAVCLLHVLLSRFLLTPTARDRKLAELQERRRAAVDDAAATLRRLERDLHDGTQARLVSIAMMLGRAEERLATGGDASELIAQARTGSKEALTELRELVRGIHPPALELGLAPALETLAARCAIPVELRVLLPARPSPAIEAIAYFSVAELLTNAVKHTAATRIWVAVLPTGSDALSVSVRDNGQGGALQPAEAAGEAVVVGGLSGLAQRARSVDGALFVDSPVGGPTLVTLVLPFAGPQ
ncbi:sensor histidine kinase [Nocardia seriolae]|nr:sensor histidine kinase [Nocardia seriolae]WKY52946.1 sensor domain-containing protein [Nocardia seriolae]WNJ58983.1 sensor domain-containing protein [Nocardia seriolae]BEK91745.1 sensor histidine kinase [Nocardia seriolae]BEK99431.1 sensor histidine kinase [Nocardia seriolae]GEM22942.1 histidine kinase [Nocardia seriolae NBRC 15557]